MAFASLNTACSCCEAAHENVGHLSAIASIIVNDACVRFHAAKSLQHLLPSSPATLFWLSRHQGRVMCVGYSWLMPIAEILGKAALQHPGTALDEDSPPGSHSALASAPFQPDTDRPSQLATQRNDSPLAGNATHADKENVSVNQDAAEPKQQTKAAKSLRKCVPTSLAEALVTAAHAAKVGCAHGCSQESAWVFRKHVPATTAGFHVLWAVSLANYLFKLHLYHD